jgi:uncharacterized protein (TIGR03435 family)
MGVLPLPTLVLAMAVLPAAAAAQQAAAPAPPATDGPAFEVASVKAGVPLGAPGFRRVSCPSTPPAGQWTCTNEPLVSLICMAWNLDVRRLSLPPSMGDVRYDIVAKVPAGTSVGDFRLMIQKLLAERIGLVTHHEQREIDVFELVIAKGGLKMKEAEPAPAGGPATPRISFDKDRIPQLPPGSAYAVNVANTAGMFTVGRMLGMDEIVRLIPSDRLIVDKTGLTGKYDFTLRRPLPAPPGSAAAAASSSNGVPEASEPAAASVESALEEQLGLRLRPAKLMADLLVVDRFNRTPTED